jgi:hypothetical protein
MATDETTLLRLGGTILERAEKAPGKKDPVSEIWGHILNYELIPLALLRTCGHLFISRFTSRTIWMTAA